MFDEKLERRGTHCTKWDRLQENCGVDPDEGIAMWVADSDFRTAPPVLSALQAMVDHGAFGYGCDDAGYRTAVGWWQQTRHRWAIDPDWIVTTQGLGHAIGMVCETFTQPGDGVCFFTPVYHEFRNKTLRAERRPVEIPLAREGDRYVLDFDAADAAMDPSVKVLLFCAPQNPSGRVWTADEMRAVAEFAARHDLILVSDEVHGDLVFPGSRHVPMGVAAPEHSDRLIAMSASSKTFNLPGLRTGYAIIPDNTLRAAYMRRLSMLEYAPATVGVTATQAAYSPEGAAWVDDLVDYLDGNRRVFDAGIDAIPGLHSMPLQSTFLAWVDFAGTGMTPEEIAARIRDEAKIGVSPGPGFGAGGELFNRFNLATHRSVVEEAVARMQQAFSDLQ
ncbi:PatB family C-S lyase [Roseibacterium sp. SDUM158017]|uniref:MalY/PatB family protein n=1 Tax=Roseicyclus salinarum TaxID=3036773 RepID=UPI0024152EB1|nr:PatB family C-S lyase [Roseibacterium sp. SDUM158017]MDG4648988.1 PatB family C-S lyase [Roseibacterium sp. SDUM158017]